MNLTLMKIQTQIVSLTMIALCALAPLAAFAEIPLATDLRAEGQVLTVVKGGVVANIRLQSWRQDHNGGAHLDYVPVLRSHVWEEQSVFIAGLPGAIDGAKIEATGLHYIGRYHTESGETIQAYSRVSVDSIPAPANPFKK